MATTIYTLPLAPTRINTAPMEESAQVESLEERKMRHMSKDDQALAKLGYKSECESYCTLFQEIIGEK